MPLLKEAARIGDRPYCWSEARPSKPFDSVEAFLRECFTLYRLPGVQRRPTRREQRVPYSLRRFWDRLDPLLPVKGGESPKTRARAQAGLRATPISPVGYKDPVTLDGRVDFTDQRTDGRRRAHSVGIVGRPH